MSQQRAVIWGYVPRCAQNSRRINVPKLSSDDSASKAHRDSASQVSLLEKHLDQVMRLRKQASGITLGIALKVCSPRHRESPSHKRKTAQLAAKRRNKEERLRKAEADRLVQMKKASELLSSRVRTQKVPVVPTYSTAYSSDRVDVHLNDHFLAATIAKEQKQIPKVASNRHVKARLSHLDIEETKLHHWYRQVTTGPSRMCGADAIYQGKLSVICAERASLYEALRSGTFDLHTGKRPSFSR